MAVIDQLSVVLRVQDPSVGTRLKMSMLLAQVVIVIWARASINRKELKTMKTKGNIGGGRGRGGSKLQRFP